jgi:hypothetical protein
MPLASTIKARRRESYPATDHTADGETAFVTVDTNATGFGAALYEASDGNYDEADADAVATMPCVVLALEAGTGTKKVLRKGYIRDDSWTWTPGSGVFVDTTAGALTQTAPSGSGDMVQCVGIAESATVLNFFPNWVTVEIV